MAIDKVWNEIHKNGRWGTYPSEHVIRFVARNFYGKVRNEIKILDFGCGGGAHTWYLAREGFDTYAFDGSEYAVANVEEFLSLENLAAHVEVMDGSSLSYDADFFDAIIDNVCIYANLVCDIEKMYNECYRVLKPGGLLLSAVFGTETMGCGTGVELEENTYENMTCGRLEGRGKAHFFKRDELEKVMAKAGFKDIRIDEMMYTDDGIPVQMYIARGEK